MWCHSKNLCCYGNEFDTTNSAVQLHCGDQVWKRDWLRTSKLLISPIIIKCGKMNYEEQMKGEYFNYFQSAMFQSFLSPSLLFCLVRKHIKTWRTNYTKVHVRHSGRWQSWMTKAKGELHVHLYFLICILRN